MRVGVADEEQRGRAPSATRWSSRRVEGLRRLHRLYSGERLVHIRGVQQGLVVAGLEFVGADEKAVQVLLDPVRDLARREPIER